MSQSAGYKHEPLKTRDSIRLLRLQPSISLNNPINIVFSEVSLSNVPSFEALSYAWESTTPEEPVFCEGQKVLVTSNCIAAMQQLRHKMKPRLLWIDAICIDQSSMVERNHQVELMGQVYSKATKVVIWLGEATPLSDIAMSIFASYSSTYNAKWRKPIKGYLLKKQVRNLSKYGTAVDITSSPVLDDICERSWFERKWAIQEYLLSSDSYFLCGTKQLQTSVLFKALKAMDSESPDKGGLETAYRVPYSFLAYLRYFTNLKTQLQSNKLENVSFTKIVSNSRAQEVTNPKDAIFGLFGILQQLNVDIAPPDYSESVEEIFTRATKAAIIHDKSLSVLVQTYESSSDFDLPSWVPEWNLNLEHGLDRRYFNTELSSKASANAAPKFEFSPEGNELSVQGCFADAIHRVARHHIVSSDRINTMAWQEWISLADALYTYPAEEILEESLFSILTPPGSLSEPEPGYLEERFKEWLRIHYAVILKPSNLRPRHSQPTHIPRREDGLQHISSLPVDSKIYKDIHQSIRKNEKAKMYDILACETCRELRYFTTSAGYMGKAHKTVQEGDLVALIAGVEMPMILRKRGDRYISKGPCYVHGMMNGEKWPSAEKELVDIIII